MIGFIIKNEIVLGAVLGAVIGVFGTIVGVFFTGVVELIRMRVNNEHAIKLKRMEFSLDIEKRMVIEPVICFIDKHLKAIQKKYSEQFLESDAEENKTGENKAKDNHILEMASMIARVKSLSDVNLDNKFNDFTRSLSSMYNREGHEQLFKKLKRAEDLGGEIMALLLQKLR